MERDGSTREDAYSRLSSQLSIEEKAKYADILIDNSGTKERLEDQVDAFVEDMRRSAGWTWIVNWLIPPVGVLSAVSTLLFRALKRQLGYGPIIDLKSS